MENSRTLGIIAVVVAVLALGVSVVRVVRGGPFDFVMFVPALVCGMFGIRALRGQKKP